MHPITNAQVLRELTRAREDELAGRARRVESRARGRLRARIRSAVRAGAGVAARSVGGRPAEERR
jgi:hypothetical protein